MKKMAYSSKTFLLLGFLLALALLISSEVSARDLAETAAQTQESVEGEMHRGNRHGFEHGDGQAHKRAKEAVHCRPGTTYGSCIPRKGGHGDSHTHKHKVPIPCGHGRAYGHCIGRKGGHGHGKPGHGGHGTADKTTKVGAGDAN